MTGLVDDDTRAGLPVFRFAPSPNGYLHLGHARSALMNFEAARASGGRFLLRIEDIDRSRCRPDYEQAIYEDLAWLGLTWDQPVCRQSEHFDRYRDGLARLEDMGLLYPSFESRTEILRLIATRDGDGDWPRDPDGVPHYPGTARQMPPAERRARIAAGESYALRLDVAAALARTGPLDWQEGGVTAVARPEDWGDIIVARKDLPTSYHIAVVLDDAAQGITDVVRGQDLTAATSLHRLLQALLGLPAPRYRHHALVVDGHGRKLSKSTGATALRDLRRQGATPADIRRMVRLA